MTENPKLPFSSSALSAHESADPCGSQSTSSVRPWLVSAAARKNAETVFPVPPFRFATATFITVLPSSTVLWYCVTVILYCGQYSTYCLTEHSTVPADTRLAAFLVYAEPRFTRWRLADEVQAEHLVEEHEKSLVSTLRDKDNVRPLEPM